jgi:hypothetical protein
MLEIYNEQVRDLLTKDNPKGGLQVYEFNHGSERVTSPLFYIAPPPPHSPPLIRLGAYFSLIANEQAR